MSNNAGVATAVKSKRAYGEALLVRANLVRAMRNARAAGDHSNAARIEQDILLVQGGINRLIELGRYKRYGNKLRATGQCPSILVKKG